MISRFFIDRPIFASVISIIIVLAGLTALRALPVEQYPNITPPQIQVTATYAGADAQTVADAVAAPIEQQVNGVQDMIYMYSQNSSLGNMTLSVFFNIGSDINLAQINVQNRVSMALPQLPESVQHQGVSVQKQTPSILMIVAVDSPDGRYDDIYVSNYSTINILNELLRIPGISNAQIIGARDYSMRIWLRPDKMAQLQITAKDVVDAIKEQNSDYGIGQLGRPPNVNPVQILLPVSSQGRLATPEEFEKIILRAELNGSMVLLKDIGRAELGAQNYDVEGKLNRKTSAMIAIYQEYGANAIDVADRVKAVMEKLSKNFPKGLVYTIPYDTTIFVKASIKEVAMTILEAACLVVLVVLLFLQNLRATLVPVIAMLVSIVGTFAGMYVLGFSLNTLTLFGLVLAIGIVVDDAIVVIENVERNMREFGLSAKEAAGKAMDEVTGPVIAIVFVLCAVFIPVAFLGGIAGQLYKQFAITISISVVFSGLVALTLSPALAAILLKHSDKPSKFTVVFDRIFNTITHYYSKGTGWLIGQTVLGLAIFAGILVALFFFFKYTPTGFVPNEDQGYLIVMNNLPDGASLGRTSAVSDQIIEIASKDPAVEQIVSLAGFSLMENLNRSNVGTNFVILKDWSVREKMDAPASKVLLNFRKQFSQIENALVIPFNPPAIQGLGTVGGFEFWIENRGDGGIESLQAITYELIEAAKKRPELTGLSTALQANNMQLYLDLDRFKARSLGVPIGDVYQTLQILLGSLYVNNFNKYGRVFQVTTQAEPKYREKIDDIGNMYVRSSNNKMVPLTALVTTRYSKGPTLVSRFNGFIGSKIIGNAAPGFTSGQAMDAMEEVAREILPLDMGFSWSGESYQEKSTGGTSASVLLAGLLMVFLILAALYEKWSLPFSIILAVPFGIFGAFAAIWIRGLANDVYFQVGLVTLIALSAKNAILIVEFAVMKRNEGMSVIEAALHAAKLRFRAILMTSLTFIFGVIPLVISTGAGAASRHSVGTGVMGGMISATLLAIFFVPLFFKLIMHFSERGSNKGPGDKEGT
ncbi:MAG: hydrophobe/amphiphile efflux-1 family RND transporter [Parachlamydia sp.]|nr:MAG: hydrophobe/amphiphile efflux-1 family RND transporter [Parachlamydia sp.]